MDPLCHTLVGAALGCTGLESRSRYGRVALIVGANLPDIDVVAHFMDGPASYAYRRGITHGAAAMVLLPALLTLFLLGWYRLRGPRGTGPPMSPRWLLLLCLIAVWSHPLLDWLNTYGMRWLMPFVDRWFYGDTLFIMDWIVWVVLIAGLVASRGTHPGRRARVMGPAALSLAAVLAYIGFNMGVTRIAEDTALRALADDPPGRLMASPVPFDPRRRLLVLEYAESYRFARFDFRFTGESEFVLSPRHLDRGDPDDLQTVAATRHGRWFLHWARFPYSISETTDGGRTITVADARYVPDIEEQRLDGFAVYRMTVDPGAARPAAAPSP